MVMENKFLFLGAPGVGKGTLAKQVANTTGLFHLSTGDIFRSVMQEQGALSQTLAHYMNQGLYVPDELTNQTFWHFVTTHQNELHKGFILDGYPRTLNQLEFLQSKLQLDQVFHLKLSDPQVLVARILNRLVCPSCGSVYNKQSKPPLKANQCDRCHAMLQARNDDTEAVILKRLTLYEDTVKPLIEAFTKQGILTVIEAQLPLEQQVNLVQQLVH
ncbi:nucleoside monophosphate kinase [Mycoplasmoides pneumoniae]|uniref:nucleoside monophosphate kinase n=1 Tax=Mycoplasmoides pneumoniae TaxID=2104 RepID=UPI0009BC4ADA|nr:nucleoside monophosphate kinase [Mycoplasmoides pneumoniae]